MGKINKKSKIFTAFGENVVEGEKMDAKKLFDKYYSRLAREGMWKSLFSGLTIGFIANFVVAAIWWYYGLKNGLLWPLLTLVVVTGGLTPLFYFKKYKPNEKQVAKRLDGLGLQERMITMTELQEEKSFIAQKQREDARGTLHAIDASTIRFIFSKLMVTAVAIAFVLGCCMTTFSGLTSAGVLKPGKNVVENIIPENPADYITITYAVASGEGLIEGDDVQIIEKGASTTEVIAVADDGFAFKQWSDGNTEPARSDIDLTEDLLLEAEFVQIGDGGEGMGEGEGEGEGQAGEGDEPGKSDKPSDEEGEPNNGANGAYEENNLIYDGTKPYKDYLQEFMCYEDAIKWLETAENIPPELKEFVQTYFNIIV